MYPLCAFWGCPPSSLSHYIVSYSTLWRVDVCCQGRLLTGFYGKMHCQAYFYITHSKCSCQAQNLPTGLGFTVAKKLIVSWYFLCSTSGKTELRKSGVHQWCWKFQFECNKLSSFPIMAYNGYVLARSIQSKVHSFCLSSTPARRRKVLRSFTFFQNVSCKIYDDAMWFYSFF